MHGWLILTLAVFVLPVTIWEAQEFEPLTSPPLRMVFASQVDRQLEVPETEQGRYGDLVLGALWQSAGTAQYTPQYVLLVDRSPQVQAALLYWVSEYGEAHYIGASPASTGKPGGFEYFETPIGLFEHTISNLDFRAEGTRNKKGIRGYGSKGMRVYDFGWVTAPRSWDEDREGVMRLQVHSTDPDLLEPRLGVRASKGCIRVPAAFNDFLDRYGILDADYAAAMSEGRKFFVMRPEREPTPWPGRYLLVVDTKQTERPSWSPLPPALRKK
jgi:hypothetical protein